MIEKQERFLELFEPVQENLWRYCLSVALSRERAEDLLQQTIEAAYRQFESLKSKEAFLSWLFTIASRFNIRNSTKEKRIVVADSQEFASIISEDFPADKLYDVRLLYEMLGKLPPEQKEAIILQDINGLSQKEICEIQGVSVETLKQRLYRGRKKLAELMSDKKQLVNHPVESVSVDGGKYE